VGETRAEGPAGDPWILVEARKLGFEPDPGSITIACTGWPLAFIGLPSLWSTYSRILIAGPDHAALFKADVTRQDPKRVVWSGNTSELRVGRALGWILRGGTPGGHHFYVDARSEARRLSGFLDG